MSEFSECFYLRSDNPQDGIDLLKRAGFQGAVFKPSHNWVTVIPDSPMNEAVESMKSVNKGSLLHYMYAEDHGWSFSIFKQDEQIFHYDCSWEDDIEINDKEVHMEAVEEFLLDPSEMSDFNDLLYPNSIDDLADDPRSRKFAGLIGLEYFEWMSWDYITRTDPEYFKDSLIMIE